MSKTRRYAPLAALLFAAAALSLTACAASSSSPSAASPPPLFASSAAPVAATTTAPAPSPSPSPSEVACTSRACIISDAKQLVGDVAKDESVITAMACEESTVKHLDPGIWSVHCTATYSDGSQVDGIATVLLTSSQVTWEPTD